MAPSKNFRKQPSKAASGSQTFDVILSSLLQLLHFLAAILDLEGLAPLPKRD